MWKAHVPIVSDHDLVQLGTDEGSSTTDTLKFIARRGEAIQNRYNFNRGFIFTFFLLFFGSLTSTTCDDSLLAIETLSAEARNDEKTKNLT